MTFTTLISTTDLAHHGADPRVVIVDCRFTLDDPAWGHRAYLESHVPGAVYMNLDTDLSGPKTEGSGRHPLPDPVVLAETLGSLGISRSVQVVAYICVRPSRRISPRGARRRRPRAVRGERIGAVNVELDERVNGGEPG